MKLVQVDEMCSGLDCRLFSRVKLVQVDQMCSGSDCRLLSRVKLVQVDEMPRECVVICVVNCRIAICCLQENMVSFHKVLSCSTHAWK